MTAGTATIVVFDGTNENAATTGIDSLGIASADKVISYRVGNFVYVIRFEH